MGNYKRLFFTCVLAAPLIGCASQSHVAAPPLPPTKTEQVKPKPKPNPPIDTTPAALSADATNTDHTDVDDDLDNKSEAGATKEKNVDPYEKLNRKIFAFNDFLDHWILHPVAKGYDTITPSPIRKGVTNFFDNIAMLTTIPNDLLQGKTAYFTADLWRFMLNSTLGIGGLFDIATRAGLPKHHEDFGLTIAYWTDAANSSKPEPYLMLPFLGPSTVRDGIGRIPDAATWPFNYIWPEYYNYGAVALNIVNKRADLLPADKLINDAFDPYIFIRSAYLQSRQHAIEKNAHETNFPPYTTETENGPSEDENLGNEL